MRTEKQRQASRDNAQKSTGPRSVEGKAKSCMNRFRTGLYTRALLLPDDNPADLEALTNEYFTIHNPQTPAERDCVDILIRSKWLQIRYDRIDYGLYTREFEDLKTSRERLSPNARLARAHCRDLSNHDSIDRQRNASYRATSRALNDLRKLQGERFNDTGLPVTPTIEAPSEDLSFEPAKSPLPAEPNTEKVPVPTPETAKTPPKEAA